MNEIIRRRAFRDGYHDGKRGRPMRRMPTPRERRLYALGRIFANCTSANVRLFEQRRVTEDALHSFAAAVRGGFLRA